MGARGRAGARRYASVTGAADGRSRDAAQPTSILARRTRGIGIAVAVALSLQLTGCAANPEEDYLRALDDSAPAVRAAHSSRDLVSKGFEACDAVATNALTTVFDGRVAEGSDGATEWGRIFAAAVENLCPEHRTRLDEWMNENK